MCVTAFQNILFLPFFPTFFPLLFLSFVDLQTITAISCSLFNESFILSGAMQEY